MVLTILINPFCPMQLTKEYVDTFMSKSPPLIPNHLFMAKFVPNERPPDELELKITLNGSKPKAVKFLVGVEGVCMYRS